PPAVLAGATPVISPSLHTVNDVAAVPPNVTAVVPVKWAPVMRKPVPPAVANVVPVDGVTDVMPGTAAAFGYGWLILFSFPWPSRVSVASLLPLASPPGPL